MNSMPAYPPEPMSPVVGGASASGGGGGGGFGASGDAGRAAGAGLRAGDGAGTPPPQATLNAMSIAPSRIPMPRSYQSSLAVQRRYRTARWTRPSRSAAGAIEAAG